LTEADNLDEIMAWREVRTVTNNLTLHYDRMLLLLEPTPFARGLARKKVDVVNYPDGRFAVQFEGTSVPFRVFDEIQTVTQGTIVENKRLGAALALVRAAGDLRAAQTLLRPGPATVTEQSGGSGHADEEPAISSRGRHGVARNAGFRARLTVPRSIVQRYVTENDDAERP
jgi:hypothetical protein